MRQRRNYGMLSLLAGLCLMTAGCAHKKVTIPQVVQAQVALEIPPEPAKAPVVETQPLPTAPTVAVKPPRRPRKKVVAKAPAAVAAAPAPVQVASTEAPQESVIGALTAGGDASPEKRQQAMEMIAGIERRLKALGTDVIEHQRTQVADVRNFVSKSRVALDSGDASGAMNLATKAKLLLDDLEK
jgi:hypothetical protein